MSGGHRIEVNENPVTFALSRYTVWQISHDPTFAPAVAAVALFLAFERVPSVQTDDPALLRPLGATVTVE